MQSNMRLLKVFTVAGVVLFVFLGLYAWHGLRYLVRRAVAAQSLHQPVQPRRLPLQPSLPRPAGPGVQHEKAAA